MDLYQQTIYKSRYARWIEEKGRRENWDETVDRYIDYFKSKHKDVSGIPWKDLRTAIYNMDIMPSMRALMTAGKALDRDNIAGYNCTGLAIDSQRAFDEAMYLLMCGAGLGFSVEARFVNKLPEIAEEFHNTDTTIVVADSRAGWASSFRELLSLLWSGRIPKWDVSKVRPSGAKLKTFGGRASGPAPLVDLFEFATQMFKNAAGRKLTSLECHDLMCKVSEVVVMGGVRRCLPHDSLVSTKTGLKKISDISVGEEVVVGKNRYSTVTAKEHTGEKLTLTINSQLGPICSSLEHRWAALNSLDGDIRWVEARYLTPDDILMFIPETIPGTKTELPSFSYERPKYSTTCKDIQIPTLDVKMAWLIGNIHGDGCIQTYDRSKIDSSDHVSVACANDLVGSHELVVEQLERFNVKVQHNNKLEEQCSKPRVSSKQLAMFMSKFKTPKTSIDIPDFILQGTTKIRAAYLAGLFDADGSAKTKPVCAVASIYPDFLKQVQAVFASLAIPVVFKLRREEGYKKNWKALYNLNVMGQYSLQKFEELIGPHSLKWKQDFINKRTKEHRSFSVPAKMLRESEYRSSFHSAYSCLSNDTNLSYYKFIKETGKDLDYFPVKIVSVKNNEVKDTYDIQVENDECFVVNGMLTHNSACISHSDLSDDAMRAAKKGQWWVDNEQRQLANNSAIYDGTPDPGLFMQEWNSLYVSKSGERGIVNRKALKDQARKTGRRDSDHDFLLNPCAEAILRPSGGLCNLTEAIVREDDTVESIKKKVELAAILGTLQASLTDFRYLRKIWEKNAKEEALLGASLTGIMDNKILANKTKDDLPEVLASIREHAVATNKEYAAKIGINQAAQVTLVKPSGTVSQLVNCASGIHPRFSNHYVRRIRMDKKDPVSRVLIEAGIPYEDDHMNNSTHVFSFPIESPDGSIYIKDLTAIEQLEHWLTYQVNWCEGNPSVTIFIKEHEWLEVGAWVYRNFDSIGGLSFLPHSGHTYKQQPYEEIDKETYATLVEAMPKEIDWKLLNEYEVEDETTSSHELACAGGSCEL